MPGNQITRYVSDLDLDQMTLILKLDLNDINIEHYTKNDVSLSTHSKVISQTGRQTYRHYESITHTHTLWLYCLV